MTFTCVHKVVFGHFSPRLSAEEGERFWIAVLSELEASGRFVDLDFGGEVRSGPVTLACLGGDFSVNESKPDLQRAAREAIERLGGAVKEFPAQEFPDAKLVVEWTSSDWIHLNEVVEVA